VAWLRGQVPHYGHLWDQYWGSLATPTAPDYRTVEDPRALFARRVRVERGDLFRLPARQWDAGTMFFVAESISAQEREFKGAVRRFIGSLRIGAPFAIAFMKESRGYSVDGVDFPAVSVTETDVRHAVEPLAPDVQTHQVVSNKYLRHGYRGMILAVGRAQRQA
jgi:hypothetical protein